MGRQPPSREAQPLGIKALPAPRALGHSLGRNAPGAVARDRQGHRAGGCLHRLLALPMTGVLLLRLVAPMRGLAQVGAACSAPIGLTS